MIEPSDYEELSRANQSLLAAIDFTLNTEDGLAFLRCWNSGDFEAIREEWPEAPEAVFYSDALYEWDDKEPEA